MSERAASTATSLLRGPVSMWSAFGAIWLAIWTAYVGVGPWLGLTMLWPVYALAILYFVFLRFRNNRTMSILFALTALTMGYSIAWGFFATTGFTPGFSLSPYLGFR